MPQSLVQTGEVCDDGNTDKDSGIVNNANDFATETMRNAKYPLELLLRVATVSVETMKIVKGLGEA